MANRTAELPIYNETYYHYLAYILGDSQEACIPYARVGIKDVFLDIFTELTRLEKEKESWMMQLQMQFAIISGQSQLLSAEDRVNTMEDAQWLIGLIKDASLPGSVRPSGKRISHMEQMMEQINDEFFQNPVDVQSND